MVLNVRYSINRILHNNEKDGLLLPAATCLTLTDLMLIERSQNKGNHAKLVYDDRYDDTVMTEVRERVTFGGTLTEKGHEGTFWDAGYMPHLDLGGQFTGKN